MGWTFLKNYVIIKLKYNIKEDKKMELLENEQIKEIANFDNYCITSKGRVWSKISNKWLKPTVSQRGNHKREYVSLGRGNKKYIHQLVATAFLPNPYNLTEVDHIDTNGLNNDVNNLRWVTHQENMLNENTQEVLKKNTGYLVEIEDIKTGKLFYGYDEIVKNFGVSKATVGNHLNNKVKNPKWRLTGNRKKPE